MTTSSGSGADRDGHRSRATCRRGRPIRRTVRSSASIRCQRQEIELHPALGRRGDRLMAVRLRPTDRAGLRRTKLPSNQLATRRSGSGHHAARAVHAAGRRHRRLPHLRAADSGRHRTRFVRGLEFLPGNPKVVHHANIRVDRTPASRALDEADPAAWLQRSDSAVRRVSRRPFPRLDARARWRRCCRRISRGALDAAADLVVEVHMQPSGRPESVRPSIGLYFGDRPPTRTPAMLRLGRQDIDIPAGRSALRRHRFATSLPVDVEVQALQPHAHYRAREVRGEATLPDGTTKPLIHIADWDFRWQHVYRYVTPLACRKARRLSMRYVYDNSAGNARNPERPPAACALGPALVRRDGRPVDSGAARATQADLGTLERAVPAESRGRRRQRLRGRDRAASRRRRPARRCGDAVSRAGPADGRGAALPGVGRTRSRSRRRRTTTSARRCPSRRRLDEAVREYQRRAGDRSAIRERPQQPRQRAACDGADRRSRSASSRRSCACNRRRPPRWATSRRRTPLPSSSIARWRTSSPPFASNPRSRWPRR